MIVYTFNLTTTKKNTDSDQNSKQKVITPPVAIIYESISIYRSEIGRQYN